MKLYELLENASSGSSSAGAIATALNPDGSLEDGQFFGGNMSQSIYGPIKKHRKNRNKIKEDIQAYPQELGPLVAEARKCSNFEQFRRDFGIELKHGIYWHITDNPQFTIDKNRGPRDMSSMADGYEEKGKLMITSDLPMWVEYYGDRKFAARIDMSAVPRKSFFQVSRGFGNEFFVSDPSKARVIAVYGKDRAMLIDAHYDEILTQYINSDEDLRDFYKYAKGLKESKRKRHKAILDSPKSFKEPGVLGPTDKVDDVGPILGGKEVLNPTLSKKSFGV